jgi:hypothetical protein
MNFKQFIIIITAFFLSANFMSCSKDELLPDLEGNLVGYIYTFDEFRNLLNDHSGVLITAFGVNKEYKVISDEEGRFEFVNLPAGTYEIHFEKSGFGTLKQFGIKHLGGEPTVLGMPFGHDSNGLAFFLIEVPTTGIDDLRIENDSVYCEFSFIKPEPDFLLVRLYFSSTDNFELQSAQFVIDLFIRKNGTIYTAKMKYNDFPFKVGEKVFFRGRTSPYYGSGITLFNGRVIVGIEYYFDYESNSMVYPSLGNKSAQYFFIVKE